VKALRKKSRPDVGTDSPRFPGVEETTFRVKAQLVGMVTEDDRDIHLVIASPNKRSASMIVEFPDVKCNGAKDSIKKDELRKARDKLTDACGVATSSFTDLHGTATVNGVGFFDLLHGQTGVAPNGIELHPVLKFTSSNCQS
jgi:hypothetical protein